MRECKLITQATLTKDIFPLTISGYRICHRVISVIQTWLILALILHLSVSKVGWVYSVDPQFSFKFQFCLNLFFFFVFLGCFFGKIPLPPFWQSSTSLSQNENSEFGRLLWIMYYKSFAQVNLIFCCCHRHHRLSNSPSHKINSYQSL